MMKGNKNVLDVGGFALARALERARLEEGMSQQQLAKRLKTSQATICKILQNRHKPRPQLQNRIRVFLGRRWPLYAVGSDEWLRLVQSKATKSEKFAALLTSAMALIEENEL